MFGIAVYTKYDYKDPFILTHWVIEAEWRIYASEN